MADHDRDTKAEQALAQLTKQYEDLKSDKIRTEQNLENLTSQLSELEARAREEYGTDDPEELGQLLKQRRAANDKAVDEYRRHLESVREGLRAAEQGLERE